MYLHHYKITEVLGPGKRLALWLQGCKKACPGCINPEGREPNAGDYYPLDKIKQIITDTADLTGLTISGGEPLLQYDELAALTRWTKENFPLDIILFSGYKLEELLKEYPEAATDLLSYVDVLIDGPYIEKLNTGTYLKGSDNQRFHFLSGKYKNDTRFSDNNKNREFEFELAGNGELFLAGLPPVGFYEKLLNLLRSDKNFEEQED